MEERLESGSLIRRYCRMSGFEVIGSTVTDENDKNSTR